MDKIKQFFISAWGRLKARWVGFFLLIPIVVFNLVTPFVYMSGFSGTDYMSAWAVILPLITAACFALAFFKQTARYAPVAMFLTELLSLLVFVKTSYMHLTTAFFGGINGNVFVQAGFSYSFCTVVYVLGLALAAVAMCFRQYKSETTFFGNIQAEAATVNEHAASEEVGE